MKKTLVIFFTLFILNNLSGQVVFNTSYHNLGEINKDDKKYFDFTLTNAGKKTAFLLRIEEPYGIDIKFSKKQILPDSTIIVRVKYTPKRKGKFKKDIPIWVSVNSEPITLTLEGDAKSFDINESLKCPDFSSIKQPQKINSDLTIKVIDAATKKPIKDTEIMVIWDGLNYKTLQTDKKGIAVQNLKWDIYYFVVNAEGYGTEEIDFYVNRKNNYLEFELTKLSQEEIIASIKDTIKEVENVNVESEKIEAITEEVKIEDTISTKELPVNLYVPNNIVFCIDVSVSMKQKGRLDLLKASMMELLNGLRPIDKLGIVTYASSTELVLAPQYVTNKASIMQLIKELTAGGYTAGAKGIKKAYQVARENLIDGGNNQVIIATDGAFNVSSGNKGILKNVEANLKKGVSISVVGVKNEKWTVKSMTSIAKTGNGHYIHIKSYEQAQRVLMDEIKMNSRKSN